MKKQKLTLAKLSISSFQTSQEANKALVGGTFCTICIEDCNPACTTPCGSNNCGTNGCGSNPCASNHCGTANCPTNNCPSNPCVTIELQSCGYPCDTSPLP